MDVKETALITTLSLLSKYYLLQKIFLEALPRASFCPVFYNKKVSYHA